MTHKKFNSIKVPAAVLALLSGLSLLAGPARAFDDKPSAIGALSSVVGIIGGGSSGSDENIDFRERPPLVVPKAMDLPTPRPGGATRATNWPQDQDVVRRREEQARARTPQQIEVNKNPTLDKKELLAGRNDDQSVAVPLCDNYKNGVPDCEGTTMEKIKRVFTLGNSEPEVVVVGKEPDRGYLTEPPKGYRKATQVLKATSERPYERPDDSDPRKYLRDEERRNSDYR
jgi:hypothetical protein